MIDPCHPVAIARRRQHARRDRDPCPADDKTEPRPACECTPPAEDLTAVWAGRRRMAVAREAAGTPLDDVDRDALDLVAP